MVSHVSKGFHYSYDNGTQRNVTTIHYVFCRFSKKSYFNSLVHELIFNTKYVALTGEKHYRIGRIFVLKLANFKPSIHG
jgi:hypothetical protein